MRLYFSFKQADEAYFFLMHEDLHILLFIGLIEASNVPAGYVFHEVMVMTGLPSRFHPTAGKCWDAKFV